jgi:hypothetical protein
VLQEVSDVQLINVSVDFDIRLTRRVELPRRGAMPVEDTIMSRCKCEYNQCE